MKRSRPAARLRREQLVQAGLVERHLAGVQRGDLVRVDVEAEHLVAELGDADGVRRAEVAGAEDVTRSSAPRRVTAAMAGSCGRDGIVTPSRCTDRSARRRRLRQRGALGAVTSRRRAYAR